MPQVSSLESVTPSLSFQLWNFAVKDPGPGGWEWLFAQARAADAAGIDRLVVSDHVVLGENLGEYGKPEVGGTAGGQQPTGPDGQWLEPMTLLSMVAAQTTHARLHTGILIAALRRPVVLAKTLATLDTLSLGRLDLGVGVGWQREEYDAAGMPFEGRGRTLDHTMEVCQALWNEESASYSSDGVEFSGVHCNPKPLQAGGVPFWISGRLNKNVLRRIARFGAGWIPWGDDANDPAAGLARIREALDEAGRDSKGFQVTSYLPIAKGGDGGIDVEATMAVVPAMAEAGITDFRAQVPVPQDPSEAQDFFAGLVAAFRKAAGRS